MVGTDSWSRSESLIFPLLLLSKSPSGQISRSSAFTTCFLSVSPSPVTENKIKGVNPPSETKISSSTNCELIYILIRFFILESFNTMVDIRLKEWTESQLADRSIEAGSDALRQEFVQFVDKSMSAKESDPIFHDLKKAVLEEALKRHRWESKVSLVFFYFT